jgi:hypothetical protein
LFLKTSSRNAKNQSATPNKEHAKSSQLIKTANKESLIAKKTANHSMLAKKLFANPHLILMNSLAREELNLAMMEKHVLQIPVTKSTVANTPTLSPQDAHWEEDAKPTMTASNGHSITNCPETAKEQSAMKLLVLAKLSKRPQRNALLSQIVKRTAKPPMLVKLLQLAS